MIKIGDNVRFLNATGGGVVKRIDTKKELVYVEDTDGFEVPVLMRECVVVPKVSATTNVPIKDFKSKPQNVPTVQPTENIQTGKEEVKEEIEIIETPEGEKLTALICFFPKDIKQLQTTDYECYLINDSNYFLFYNVIIGQNDEFRSIANGILEPNIQDWIADIKKSDLNDWEQARVQIIAYKRGKNYTSQNVIDIKLKLNVVRFYKLHSFIENDYFDEPALLVNLIEEKQKAQLKSVSAEEIKEAIVEKKEEPRPKRERSRSHKRPQKAEIIEIDLHAQELLDNTAGMSNADILNYQLDKFHEVLALYKDKRGQRIVFIHGKGEGILRKEIENQLKTKYKSYYFQDASFKEYGFGATLVMIR